MTLLDSLIQTLTRAGDYNRDDQVAPAVILWPDRERQWEGMLPLLRERLPHLLTFGTFDATKKTGPGIWLRCMIGRTLPAADWSATTTPILYLPGVSRQELRTVAECPPEMMPLVELQYRGAIWSQVSHKDWTVLAFLQSADGGLGLDVARDSSTLEAMKMALAKLAETELQDLTGHRLEASDFHALLSPDPVREILGWLNDPSGTQKRLTKPQWEAFSHTCKDKYGFHPAKDGPLRAAELLAKRAGAWKQVWSRFREAPKRHGNVSGWLRKAKPPADDLFLNESDEVWPQANETHEASLRHALRGCEDKPVKQVVIRLADLEKLHGQRRRWVWSDLEQSPLAIALEHLSRMAEVCAQPVIGGGLEELTTAYVNEGWRADEAVLAALGQVEKKDDVAAVQAVVRAVYLPWLEASALAFQKLVAADPAAIQSPAPADVSQVAKGTVILFADGLRFDLAKMLMAQMAEKDLPAELDWRWTALPPVTPTAKPAASPITRLITGGTGEEFRPQLVEGGKDLTSDRFKKLLEAHGCQVLTDKHHGQPDGVGWMEYGSIDSTGHKEGWKLARRLGEELKGLTETIHSLLESGWKNVRVVTDHGWLLMPGGLPKVTMPKYLVESRWGRCAVMKDNVQTKLPSVPWHWNPGIQVVVPPGVGAFKAKLEYTHGGLCIQECLVPVVNIGSAAPAATDVAINSIKWVGLRCRIQASVEATGMLADIRTSPADAGTSLVSKTREIEPDGQASLLVANDQDEGKQAVAVLLNAAGMPVAQKNTVIGV